MPKRFVIIGGGPAGNTAATTAARLGAEVTLIERDLVGGAAHLLDRIPSSAMIATGGTMGEMRRACQHGPRRGRGPARLRGAPVAHRARRPASRARCAACSRARASGWRQDAPGG
ncbi:MAG: FAD-dependent oxidoreductase [Acidimicrobiales bacterium]